MELDRTLWRDRDHIGIKQLWEQFCSYLYLPRLRDQNVLLKAIEDGINTVVASEDFTYAEGYDEIEGRYLGLRLGGGGSVAMDSSSLLVKPEVAQKQIGEEPEPSPGEDRGTPPGGEDWTDGQPAALPRRFHASVTLDPDRVGRDAGRIADEVITHLSLLPGATLKVSMEIEAEIPEGVSEDVQRTVSENAGVLKFESYGFEQE